MKLQAEALTLVNGDRILLSDFSATFQAGKVYGILGPNGCGKTTLLHTLAGLRKPKQGNVLIEKQSIRFLKPKDRAKKIGLLPQDTVFSFPGTVLETVLLGRHPHQEHWFYDGVADIERATQALSQVNLGAIAHRSVHQLSGGEKRRVAIAAILAQDPAVYLLDEPSSHLDIVQQFEALSLLVNQVKQRQKILVMALHDLTLLRHFCDEILVMGFFDQPLMGVYSEIYKALKTMPFFAKMG